MYVYVHMYIYIYTQIQPKRLYFHTIVALHSYGHGMKWLLQVVGETSSLTWRFHSQLKLLQMISILQHLSDI